MYSTHRFSNAMKAMLAVAWLGWQARVWKLSFGIMLVMAGLVHATPADAQTMLLRSNPCAPHNAASHSSKAAFRLASGQ